MTSPRPLSALEGLTSDDLNLLATWLDQYSYRKVVELAEAEFKRRIPKTTLQRFAARNSTRALLDDSPDALQAATEINQFAATACTAFSDATLHILERRAFELVLILRTEKQMAALKDLLFLSHKHRSTQVRERQVKVQEEKLALRQAEKQKPDFDPAVQTFTDRLHHAFKNHPLFSPSLILIPLSHPQFPMKTAQYPISNRPLIRRHLHHPRLPLRLPNLKNPTPSAVGVPTSRARPALHHPMRPGSTNAPAALPSLVPRTPSSGATSAISNPGIPPTPPPSRKTI